MPVTVVVGAQWGDEGKGRIVDFLAGAADVVARFGGGPNAGHTVKVGGTTYKLSSIPSGVVAGTPVCIVGPGAVVAPAQFVEELEALEAGGIGTSGVWLSDLAHLIMPYHVELDRASEEERGASALGTTGKGIGPAYMDRAARSGVRAGDLRDLRRCRRLIEARASTLARQGAGVDVDANVALLERFAPKIVPRLRDTVSMLDDLLAAGKRVIAEGAQGSLLDVTLGTYPHVTSSVTVAGGAAAGLGVGPTHIRHVVGVAKAYVTRVGAGAFPTELDDDMGRALRERGGEFGVVTGRPRRCGWLDLPALRYAARISGFTHLALTKLDVLDNVAQPRICDAYEGATDVSLPFALDAGARPRYMAARAWSGSIGFARSWDELPAAARSYVETIERALEIPVAYVSVGAERSQMIVRSSAPLAPVVAHR